MAASERSARDNPSSDREASGVSRFPRSRDLRTETGEADAPSHRLLQEIVEGIGQSILLYDEKERLRLFNRRFLDSYPQLADFVRPGRSMEEMTRALIGVGHLGPSPPDEAATAAAVRRRLRQLRRPAPWIEQRVSADGRNRQIEVSRTSSGGLIIIGTDVTEAVARSRDLRETEARLREVFASSPTGLALCRRDGTLLEANGALARLFAREPDECRGVNLHDLLGEASAASRSFFEALDTARPPPLELELMLEGRRRWCRLRGHAYEGGGDSFVWLIVEDRTSERQAAFLEERFAEVQRVARIGNWEWDIATNALWWSSGVFEIYGLDSEAYAPSYPALLEWLHPDDRGAFQAAVARALDGDATYETEHRIIRPSGEIRWLHGIGTVSRDAAERPVRMTGIVQDITERLNTEAQLRQAQKMEAIGQLAGGIAHDFNNLLGVVVGNLDLLSAELPPNSRAARLLSRALGAAERGAGITERLLGFARQQALAPRSVMVNPLVEETIALLGRTLPRSVSLDLRLAPDLPPCYVDPGQLESALLNLALNARDAMPAGGCLSIETGRGADDGRPSGFLWIEVADSGFGIPAEILARVTEPFFTTKAPGKGSGLGLAMVYGFAERSDGRLEIVSTVGRGTRVRLELPIAAAGDHPGAMP